MPRALSELLYDVRWALAGGLGPRDLIPMLEHLVRATQADTPDGLFARQQLSELLLERAPWRAARLATEVLQHEDDHPAWAVLGLAHTLLGHYRSAARAFRAAVARSPGTASYHHNLGHLMDVAMGRPARALPSLQRAIRLAPTDVEIAASYAHALRGVGREGEALRVLRQALRDDARAAAVLERWVERAASPVGGSAS
ncbi:MAG: hypothetical protein KIT72_11905 [Polyangiaceae bacterium]|nr:hypothetical protein [Polyangiaceae bacterium]MCW5791118.1 hypothetical protein [Polyangiaceae bacterium]